MRGLLIKDTYVLMKTMRLFAVISLIMAVYPSDVMRGFAIIYAVLTPMSAFALDEQAKWDSLAVMMPYTIRDIVLSKYLLGAGSAAAISLLAAFTGVILQNFEPVEIRDCLMLRADAVFLIFGTSLILLSLNLPILFKFGVEKGRIAYIFASVVIAMGFLRLVGDRYEAWNFPQWMSAPVMVAVGAVMLAVSVMLSIKVCNGKRQ